MVKIRVRIQLQNSGDSTVYHFKTPLNLVFENNGNYSFHYNVYIEGFKKETLNAVLTLEGGVRYLHTRFIDSDRKEYYNDDDSKIQKVLDFIESQLDYVTMEFPLGFTHVGIEPDKVILRKKVDG